MTDRAPEGGGEAGEVLRQVVAASAARAGERLAAFVRCRCPCGARAFQVHLDEEAGFATLGCMGDTECDLPEAVLSARAETERAAWDRATTEFAMCFCTCGRGAAEFEVGVGISTRAGKPGRAGRVYLGLGVSAARGPFVTAAGRASAASRN